MSLDLYRIKPQDLLLIEGVSYCVKSVIEYKKEHVFWKEFKLQTDAGLQFWLTVDRDSRNSKCKLFSRTDTSSQEEPGFSVYGNYYTATYKMLSSTATVIFVWGESDLKQGDTVECYDYTKDKGLLVSYKKINGIEYYVYGHEIKAADVLIQNTPAEDPSDITKNNSDNALQNHVFKFKEMSELTEGQKISICGTIYRITECVVFFEDKHLPLQNKFLWAEYEIHDDTDEKKWLSVDEDADGNCVFALHIQVPFSSVVFHNDVAVSLSPNGATTLQQEELQREYRLSDDGSATVFSSSPSGDYDFNERMNFSEYRSDDNSIVTCESWGFWEKEASVGKEISAKDIELLEMDSNINDHLSPGTWFSSACKKLLNCLAFLFMLFVIAVLEADDPVEILYDLKDLISTTNTSKQIASSKNYIYQTSVTLDNKVKAKVYSTALSPSEACEDLIRLAPEKILYITTTKNGGEKKAHLIQSSNSTVMVYHSDSSSTYVQATDKQFSGNVYTVYHAETPQQVESLYFQSKAWYGDPYRHSIKSLDLVIDVTSYDQSIASARQNSVSARRLYGGGTRFGK